ncbi:hypothetical protein HYT01_02120 [Candidatus Giovannonibacteria bacterium]|nr:hypothetical protein [Candidatus Giovannonibacteria bacterium]
MENLIFALLAWLGTNTSYDISAPPPRIEYKTMRELSDMMYGDIPMKNRTEILAVYSVKTDTIHLGDGFAVSDKQHQAILLHELTHHLQNKNNVKVRCSLLYEPEAYRLMKKWSEDSGIPYQGPGELTIQIRFSSCPEDD